MNNDMDDATAKALADAVDAYRTLLRSNASRRPGHTHRANSRASIATIKIYADAAGVTVTEAGRKVAEIARMFAI